MSYLRNQRYHGILRFRYLPYRLDQVFSYAIPAIPAIPRYFGIHHTSSIRYFQMRYSRYPRVPWYVIPRVFTGVTPVNTQHDALPPVCFPTEDKRPEVIRAGTSSFQNVPKFRLIFYPGKYPTRCTTPVFFPNSSFQCTKFSPIFICVRVRNSMRIHVLDVLGEIMRRNVFTCEQAERRKEKKE